MEYKGHTGEYFGLESVDHHNCDALKMQTNDTLRMLWFTSDDNTVVIDGISYSFHKNEVVFLTQFHNLEISHINTVNLLRFNRPFYCILDHDSEVGCKGILYYGAAKLALIQLEGMELEILKTAWRMAVLEFEMQDSLQLEMLQMMLKRILILCTRIYKSQTELTGLDGTQNDLVREFNYLVETHFKEKHQVSEYAELLFKSPKTITNAFKKLGEKSPLHFIQERLLLESRRLLWYTGQDVSEIAYELGFNDVQTFSRFFKKQQGSSPTDFREQRIRE
ncbi:MAG: helix-turn-helix domain-containing protein [Cyclobacteriaceae bacterium]